MSRESPVSGDVLEPRGPVLVKVIAFSLALALVFTLVANTLPQVEGEAPSEEEVAVDSLTMDSFVALGERLFEGKGTCALCHNDLGRAPDLLAMNVQDTARARLDDPRYGGAAADAEAYLRESLLAPSAYVVEGYGKKGSDDAESPMPAVDKPPIQLSAVEVDALIAFLQAKDGHDITVPLPRSASESKVPVAAAESTAPPAAARTAEEAITKFGCAACHSVPGSESPLGPRLDDVGGRLDPDAIRESIIDPEAVVAEGFPGGVMPPDFAERMTVKELELLVGWLAEQRP